MLPGVHLTYGVPLWITPLYESVEIEADEVLSLDFSSFRSLWKTMKNIRRGNFDLIIELHQSGRSGKLFKFHQLTSSSQYFFHNHNWGIEVKTVVLDQGVRKPLIQRDLDTCYSALCHFGLEVERPKYLQYPPDFGFFSEQRAQLVFGVVATREEKMWPIEYFAQLAMLCRDQKVLIPLSSSSQDQKLKERFLSVYSGNNVEFVEVSLRDLPTKLGGSVLYVGNDTGIKHLCVALNMRTLTLFGPEEPLEWHPYDIKQHPYFWSHGHDIRTKMLAICALRQFDNSRPLSGVLPEEVFNQAKNILEKL